MKRTFKIGLVTSRDGRDWSAQGWGSARGEDAKVRDLLDSCSDCVDKVDGVQFIVEVTVDIPEPVVVVGTATEDIP